MPKQRPEHTRITFPMHFLAVQFIARNRHRDPRYRGFVFDPVRGGGFVVDVLPEVEN